MNNTASFGLILAFLALVSLVVGALLLSVRHAARVAGRDPQRDLRRASLVVGLWIAFSGAAGFSGLLLDFSLPPKLPIFVSVGFGLTFWLAFSEFGAHLARSLPLWVLVGIHAFRWPLEVLMNEAHHQGVMPIQMSYSGHNFDVVTGILGAGVGLLVYKKKASIALVRAFNAIGLTLLTVILTIAVLSMPLPIRQYTNEPANTWVATFPFVWLPAVLVMSALLGHLLIIRRLAFDSKSAGSAHPAAPQAAE